MIEKNNPLDWRTHLAIIGAPTSVLRSFITPTTSLQLVGTTGDSFANHLPQSIVCHNGIIAVIDQKNSLWIIGNSFQEPINLTEVVRMKAKRVFLGEGQLIFENKKHGSIVVTWGGKVEIGLQKLKKINIHHRQWRHIFDAYIIDDPVLQRSNWCFSTVKKVENSIKLYQINRTKSIVTGFPTFKTIDLPQKIMGMSLGKHHVLCWTVSGRIFSWGCKNLALGLKNYDKSYYDEAQEVAVQQPILKAHAGLSYSIVLSESGKLYEWGIGNSDEPIITPRHLSVGNLKFVDIKGLDNVIGGLTSNNELYVWGKDVGKIVAVPEDYNWLQPILIQKQEGIKIYDFLLQENCIIVTIGRDDGKLSRDQKCYFAQVVKKITKVYLPLKMRGKQTIHSSYQCPKNEQKKIQYSYQQPAKDHIDRLVYEHNSKKQYFMNLQNEEIVFNQIMKPTIHRKSTANLRHVRNSTKNTNTHSSVDMTVKTHRKVQSARETSIIAFNIENSNKIIKEFQQERLFLKNKGRFIIPSRSQKKGVNYDSRRQAVMLKKQWIQQQKRENRVNALQRKSRTALYIRQKQEELHQEQNRKEMMEGIAVFIKKRILIQLMLAPLELARIVKIKAFMENMSFTKISSNMKNILYKKRAMIFLRQMKQKQPNKYSLVQRVFIRAIRRWKNNKYRNFRTTLVNQIMIKTVKDKMYSGLGKIWVQTRKLQKVAKWVYFEQKERMLQFKIIWKKALLLYLKPTPCFQNKRPSACRQELNTKITYERLKAPKLYIYLSSSPIFNLHLLGASVPISKFQEGFKRLDYPPNMYQTKAMLDRRAVSWAEEQRIECNQDSFGMHDGQRKRTSSSPIIDLLPYSQHYDNFFKPKNFQINIPDNMKLSQKWIQQENKILTGMMQQILYNQWLQFCRDRLDYECKLALFIKDNYETLTEYRWKYIVEYNKIKDQKSLYVIQKERELKRLMDGIGASFLLQNDVIPQKFRMLQYIHLIKGYPVAPTLQLKYSYQQFKKQFKNYYENVSNRAKVMKKFYS